MQIQLYHKTSIREQKDKQENKMLSQCQVLECTPVIQLLVVWWGLNSDCLHALSSLLINEGHHQSLNRSSTHKNLICTLSDGHGYSKYTVGSKRSLKCFADFNIIAIQYNYSLTKCSNFIVCKYTMAIKAILFYSILFFTSVLASYTSSLRLFFSTFIFKNLFGQQWCLHKMTIKQPNIEPKKNPLSTEVTHKKQVKQFVTPTVANQILTNFVPFNVVL